MWPLIDLGEFGFALVGASALAALFALRSLWLVLLAAGVIAAAVAGLIDPIGLLALGIAALCCVTFEQATARRVRPGIQLLSGGAVVLCGLTLALHVLPGFHNPILIDEAVLKPGAGPFSLSLNFDKTIAGVMVLGWCWSRPTQGVPIAEAIGRTAVTIVVVTAVLMGLALVSGYVQWAPMIPPTFALFAGVNLTVCLSEEAFFRGFLQTQFARMDRSGRVPVVAILLSGVLFGLAHLAGGWLYVGLASLAGVGYALVYHFTRRLECSVLTHWSVNLLHFSLFTYPALARGPH